jgi:hypothetical protein
LARGAITAATVSALLLVAMAWLLNRQRILNRLAFYLAVAAAAGSSLMTAYYEFERLAAWYPRYSALTLFGNIDYFALAGVFVPIVVCIKVLPKVSGTTLSTPVRRAESGLHGQSDWFPIARAQRWFNSGGIVIGGAYRPDREPHLGGRARLAGGSLACPAGLRLQLSDPSLALGQTRCLHQPAAAEGPPEHSAGRPRRRTQIRD